MFPIRDVIPSRTFPFVNYGLIICNTIIFLYQVSLPYPILNDFFYYFGMVPLRFTDPKWVFLIDAPVGGYWTFFTNMFLHGSWFHIISNMWTLFIFGDNVEDRLGHFRYFLFYIASGLAANFTHFFFNLDSPIPVIGASGAIAGVMGAYFILFPHSKIVTLVILIVFPLFLEIPAIIYLGIWFYTQIISGTFSLVAHQNASGIAWWAHIGGFLFGVFFHRLFKTRRYY